MALHEQCVGATDEWYTPKYIFDALGCTFDVDVASPDPPPPWVTALSFITSDSLREEWKGFVWMNPPFGGRNALTPWLGKFLHHRDGICLVPDRTSEPWWRRYALQMDLVLFVAPKIKFIDRHGRPGCSPAQGTCLMSLGPRGSQALQRSQLGSLFRPA